MSMTRTAVAGLKIKFQVIVISRDRFHGGDRFFTERGSTQVGMQDNASGIDQGAEAGARKGICLEADVLQNFV